MIKTYPLIYLNFMQHRQVVRIVRQCLLPESQMNFEAILSRSRWLVCIRKEFWIAINIRKPRDEQQKPIILYRNLEIIQVEKNVHILFSTQFLKFALQHRLKNVHDFFTTQFWKIGEQHRLRKVYMTFWCTVQAPRGNGNRKIFAKQLYLSYCPLDIDIEMKSTDDRSRTFKSNTTTSNFDILYKHRILFS